MGLIFNQITISMGFLGLILGYIFREGFCLFDCINDVFTARFSLGSALIFFSFAILLNYSLKLEGENGK